jgi:probable blue pigment (indigoidine) exporter
VRETISVLRELRTSLAPLVWGTSYLTTTELLPPHRPLLAAAGRALPAGLLLLAVTRRLPVGEWWWRSAVLGGLNIGAFFALLFVTAARLPGGIAAVLTASQALLVVVLSGPMLGQRVGPWQGVAALAGVAPAAGGSARARGGRGTAEQAGSSRLREPAG